MYIFTHLKHSICYNILKQIGPFDKMFFKSDEKKNKNRASFYIFQDLNEIQQEFNFEIIEKPPEIKVNNIINKDNNINNNIKEA